MLCSSSTRNRFRNKNNGSNKNGRKQSSRTLKVIVRGISAGRRGYGIGKAKVVLNPEDANSDMKKGDILVTGMTDPDFVPFMKMASAIVTDKGGITSHAAIVSRELNIPCVVGTENATQVMKTGQEYTVDSRNGVIYEGIMAQAVQPAASNNGGAVMQVAEAAPVTATKIYMNLGTPEMIEQYKNLPFEGIGLNAYRIHLSQRHRTTSQWLLLMQVKANNSSTNSLTA